MMRPKRVLWLLNHTTLRQFEVPILQSLGYEVFVPKNFPYDEGNLSASIDYSLDAQLSIPPSDLEQLNGHNFYGELTPRVREIINTHFDIAFFAFFPEQFAALVHGFRGTLILRAFGLSNLSYSELTARTLGRFFPSKIERIERRFWFAQAYSHLVEAEKGVFRRKAITLPLGLADTSSRDGWTGSDARILFVCPRIGSSPYYANVYERFKKDFGDLPHVVGGAQPVPVANVPVTGFLSRDLYDAMLRNARVMYYHSQEDRHLHYHPFEAVRAGIPLLFMANGMLDRLGGIDLPGRCNTVQEARQKIERVLSNDRDLIVDIKQHQVRLLTSMKSEHCEPLWRAGFERINGDFGPISNPVSHRRNGEVRIAVIIPVKYRGGSLRGAKLLARAIADGSRDDGRNVEVVLGHLDDPECYPREEFADLPDSIKRRPFRWRVMSYEEASRANAYAGSETPLENRTYQTPDDGINQFTDCDLWIIVSDRLEFSLLPVRPYLLMVYDYLQRYQPFLDDRSNQEFVARAHAAEAIFVTTEFTRGDARQFAGVPDRKIRKLPMLAPDFSAAGGRPLRREEARYFLWTTNLAVHKNHETAFKALRLYYEEYDGDLECRVTGVDTGSMLKRELSHLEVLGSILRSSESLKRNLKIEGEMPDRSYRRLLGSAAFLWHPGKTDNGTFSVVEAAHLGVPSLSSDYPAMHEIDHQFALNLSWMDPYNPDDMARQLKRMEKESTMLRDRLPSAEHLASQSVEKLSSSYWNVVRDFL